MAQIGDLFARLFGGGTRGLSGDAERVLLDDPELEYFNGRLRRHSTTQDLIDDPSVIWRGEDDGRSGLAAHMRGVEDSDNLGFTDVLVVLSTDDWHRALRQLREPWAQGATQILRGFLWEHCENNDLHQIFPQRAFGFRFIKDGGHEMSGASLGLEPGQYVTGLLPNLYTGPEATSRPVISVLLNIPNVWEGYQEVGRLFSDQVQFTLGTHWLDNYCHEALGVPALYRLQQYADGSFVHIVNPDGKVRYQISSHETHEGPAVLTLAAPDGTAVAHMVLAIVEDAAPLVTQPAPEDLAPLAAPRRIKAPPSPAAKGQGQGQDQDRDAASQSPDKLAAQTASSRTLSHGGNRTVIPADVDERMLTLRETGALFQKVHFGRFMDGYDVYLGINGQIGTTMRDRSATFEIRSSDIGLVPHVDGVTVDGRPVGRGQRLILTGHADIQVGDNRVVFRDLRNIDADGWPYLGEIRRAGGASHMVFGGSYQLGRDRRSKVRLPDEPSNTNIVWRPEMAEGGTIRSRNGEIAKSRFYTDSIMVASSHAEISLTTEPVLKSLARHCYTYIRRGSDVFSLAPTQGKPGPKNMDLQAGDEILIGNCVFAVDYPPADGPRHIATFDYVPTAPKISPSDLAAAASGTDQPDDQPHGQPDPTAKADHAQAASSPSTTSGVAGGMDLPAAAGLGERGRRPMMPALTKAGPDSFMGIEPPPEPSASHNKAPAGISMAGASPSRPKPKPKPKPELVASLPELADDPPTEDVDILKLKDASPFDLPSPQVAPPLPSYKTLDGGPPVAAPAAATPPPPAFDTMPLPEDSLPTPVSSGKPTPGRQVVEVQEDSWQLELARPAKMSLIGFMVSGKVTVGNHHAATVVIPENRAEPDQHFEPRDYFEVFVRGRRGSITLLDKDEAALLGADGPVNEVKTLDDATLQIIRRAPDGEEDFRVELTPTTTGGLPDPRARCLTLADDEPLAQALFTRGLPLRHDHLLVLGSLRARAYYDGTQVKLHDYLASYRRSDGTTRAVFVQHGDGTWRTLPEDGSPVVLSAGDRILVESALYRLA